MYQREFDKKIRVGIVGAGSHSYRNLLPAMHFLPMELVAICNPSQERRMRTISEYRCPGYADAEQMYANEELDAVIISVSPFMHPSLTIQALEHNLNVFIEKPPAASADEVEDMLSHRGDRVVSVGFKKAFMPAAVKAREIAGSSKYGGLKSILAVYPMSLPEDGELVLREGRFTNWLGNGCHPISLLLSVGGEVDAVTTLDQCVSLRFKNGLTGTLYLASGPHPIERYSFFSDKWNLHIDNTSRVVLNRGIPFEYAYTNNFAPEGDDSGQILWEPQNCLATLENKSLFLQGIIGEMNAFCRAVLQGEDASFGSLEFALQVMRVYEAALISNGKTIKL